MYECERLFGLAGGVEIQNMIERVTGEPCPCKRGEPCLLVKSEEAQAAPPVI